MIRKKGPNTNVGTWAPSYLATLLVTVPLQSKEPSEYESNLEQYYWKKENDPINGKVVSLAHFP